MLMAPWHWIAGVDGLIFVDLYEMIARSHFSALSRVTLASPSISFELLTGQEIVLQESRRRPDPLHALPQRRLRNKW